MAQEARSRGAERWGRARFVVTVSYTEPTYAAHRGISPSVHRASFEVLAGSSSEAEELGRQAFRDAVALESVGWVREIVGVVVRSDDGTD
jgi:hypothetical protein